MAVRYRNTNRGCSRARRLYGVASRIAYSLLSIPGLVVGAALGTREIYFSRERNFKAAFRGHRLPRQIAFQSVSRSQRRSRRYLREHIDRLMPMSRNAQSFKLASNII